MGGVAPSNFGPAPPLDPPALAAPPACTPPLPPVPPFIAPPETEPPLAVVPPSLLQRPGWSPKPLEYAAFYARSRGHPCACVDGHRGALERSGCCFENDHAQ